MMTEFSLISNAKGHFENKIIPSKMSRFVYEKKFKAFTLEFHKLPH